MSERSTDPFLPEPPTDADDYTRRMHLRQTELWRTSLDAIEPLQRYKTNGQVLKADSTQQNGVKWDAVILTGAGPPPPDTGGVGDWYLDTSTGILYGPKGTDSVTPWPVASGKPGGSNTQVQFNDGGAFGGDTGLTWDKANDLLYVGGYIRNGDGSAGTPSYSFAVAPGTGFWRYNNTGSIRLSFAGADRFQWHDASFALDSSCALYWMNAAPFSSATSPDVGFMREAAGVLQLNSSTINQYRDLKLRQLSAVVASDSKITLVESAGAALLTSENLSGSTHKALLVYATSLSPLFDNAYSSGETTHRWTALWAVNGAIQTSDAREKTDIAPCALGLDFIEDLQPVSFKRVVGKNIATLDPETGEGIVTPVPGIRTHYGLVAQDVHNAVKASGVRDFGGLIRGDIDNLPLGDVDPDGVQGLNYSEFVAPLVKAVQELSARVKALEAQLTPNRDST